MTYVALESTMARNVLGLPSAAAKVVLYLAARADAYGTSFPAVETIAADCFMSRSSVYRGLKIALRHDLVRMVRWNEYDPLTGKKQPNVYIVSSDLLVINANYVERHGELWEGSQEFIMEILSHKRDNKHHQEATTRSNDKIRNDNKNHHHQAPPTAALYEGDDFEATATVSPATPSSRKKAKSSQRDKNTATPSKTPPPDSAVPPPMYRRSRGDIVIQRL